MRGLVPKPHTVVTEAEAIVPEKLLALLILKLLR
jgi:hypothetical protein